MSFFVTFANVPSGSKEDFSGNTNRTGNNFPLYSALMPLSLLSNIVTFALGGTLLSAITKRQLCIDITPELSVTLGILTQRSVSRLNFAGNGRKAFLSEEGLMAKRSLYFFIYPGRNLLAS